MKESIKQKCDLLISNKDKLEKEFKWGYSIMNIAAAFVFSGAQRTVDIERLKSTREVLKKNTGAFSSFRGHGEAVIASKMALKDNPEQYLNDIKTVYEKLHKGSIFDNEYLVQGAICICDAGRIYDADSIVEKYKELYKKMGKEHPILTSSGDIVFAVLLSLTDKSVDQIINEMEECYKYLKKELKLKVGSNEIQGLGEILALTDGDMKAKCDKVVKLYNTFKEQGLKVGTDYNEFASLGTLVDIDVDYNTLVNEIAEVAEYLKAAKGFGSWSLDNKKRLMFASMLVGDSYGTDSGLSNSAAISSSVAMVIAEEIALMMCMMICVSSTTTNS